ncbi:Tripeptide permease tppB, putative [Perkinsus marinus ATCC 50983]|uniref:Tripeptide permease tppB, putative n=1 Tax=Perkinsus marinus (strain ATCC 50983 / TXsc) TaxID=423536 RepID=C5KFW2_PERM5|nr:Tripeptide permease tppB, putative [Perkinsus marinus ATCC 50983]EER16664.1 Tripeptide permease tppB, putative [Perkinsus marinus ATCC 50983]|eukprot:XP_002784868.1 Tripeptide permease tppB, putative [Perkinsus marinus ATCC 50983]
MPHEKPFSWTDRSGNVYRYYRNPMLMACVFILMQEFCERLAFYGVTPNLQLFLKSYLGYSDTTADSYVSIFNAVLYITPLLGGILADTLFGVYNVILGFSIVYMIGLALLTLSSIRSISEAWMIHLSLLVLITLGAGGIKACVNVMGAQQMHPDEHQEMITRFFTYFYASINLGSIVGGVVTPILLQEVSYTASFLFPLAFFVVATIVFVVGDFMNRYVKAKPQGSAVLKVGEVAVYSAAKCSLEKNKRSKGGKFGDEFIEDAKVFFRLLPLFTLTVPFNMVYNNMATTFLTQGFKMDTNTFGWNMPAAIMQNVDAIAVVVISIVVDKLLYPALRKRGLMPPVLVRYCIGSLLAALSLVAAVIVEYVVSSNSLYTVSIWWQIPQFSLIAAGEIFLVSTSYEVAFTHAPPELKNVASAVNLCFTAIANGLSAALFQVASPWLPNFEPGSAVAAPSHYDYYYYVLIALCLVGVGGALACIPYYKKVHAEAMARQNVEVSEKGSP